MDSNDVQLHRVAPATSTSPAALTASAKNTKALASEATNLNFDVGERTAILQAHGTDSSEPSPRLRELYHELRDDSNRQH